MEYSDSFTDFERRVRKDLETIGMKPLKEDIDTLIAAGRSIIHKKKDELIGTLVNLSKRKFVNDCDEIINATKFDCWPENFKILPNILDKRLGVILKEFSDTTQRFIKKTTEKRINGIRNVQRKALKIKKELELSSKIYKVRGQILKKIKKEIDYYSLLTDRESVEITENLEKFRKLFDQDQPTFFEEAFHKSIKSLVKYKNKAGADIPLDELDYHIDPEEIYLKSHILPALDTLGTVLTGEPIQDCRSFYRIPETKAIDMASQNNLKKTKVDLVLNGKEIYCYAAENLLKEIEKRRGEEDPAVNNPMVYYYAAVLSHFLDRNDEAFYNLYAGIKSFPQVANLHGLLGYLAFLVDGNAEKAISQYNLAIEIAKARQSQLRFLKFQSHDVEDLQRIRKVKERFQYQENWNKRQLAEYLALIPGYSGFCGALCKDFEIWWEENSSKLEDTDREVPVSFLDNVEDFSNDRSIAQERKIDDGNSNAFFAKNAQDVAIEEKQESKEAVEKTDGGLSEISKYHKRSPILEFYKNDELDEEYRKIGVHFAEEIFYKYFKKAKEPLNQNDSEIQEPIPGLMHHEILYPYALHSLINSAQYECPDRRFGILKSRELLIYSISRLLDSIQILVINNEIFELKGNSSEITDRREVFENKVIDFKNDLLELNETKFQEFAESIFPKARELWVTKVAEKIKKGGKVEQAEILKDVIVLFFDLKYLTYFLGYVDELECLGA